MTICYDIKVVRRQNVTILIVFFSRKRRKSRLGFALHRVDILVNYWLCNRKLLIFSIFALTSGVYDRIPV